MLRGLGMLSSTTSSSSSGLFIANASSHDNCEGSAEIVSKDDVGFGKDLES